MSNVVPWDAPFRAAAQHRTSPSHQFRPRPVGHDGKQTSTYPRDKWLDMPAGGQTKTISNQIEPNAPAAVFLPTIGSEVTAVQFRVPKGREFTLQAIANQVITGGWVSGSGSVLWRIQVDGLALQGLSTISVPLGTSDDPGDLSMRPARFHENQLVQLICANISIITAPNINPIVGLLAGFFAPQSQSQQAMYL